MAISLAACEADTGAETETSNADAGDESEESGEEDGDTIDGKVDRGGRLYDKFFAVKGFDGEFEPDDKTTDKADGKGGPNDDGTLNDGSGDAMLNSGHDFRIKNLFGWDLRGAEGVYGPDYQDKAYVLDMNLLETDKSTSELRELFDKGSDDVPAYGEVLSDDDLDDLASFLGAIRDGELARPEQIWDLSKTAPKNYKLLDSGDAKRGHELIEEGCASDSCHGADGTELLFDDDELSLGMIGRIAGYEVWIKILNGQPGTAMGPQLDTDDPEEQAQMILDILAALCDRDKYPAGDAKGDDVEDGDERCGDYLK